MKGCLILFFFSYFSNSQIWLNHPMDDHNLGYITKLKERKTQKKHSWIASLGLIERINNEQPVREGHMNFNILAG
jgi:hypothetical protein